jgi:hypothetical protein
VAFEVASLTEQPGIFPFEVAVAPLKIAMVTPEVAIPSQDSLRRSSSNPSPKRSGTTASLNALVNYVQKRCLKFSCLPA